MTRLVVFRCRGDVRGIATYFVFILSGNVAACPWFHQGLAPLDAERESCLLSAHFIINGMARSLQVAGPPTAASPGDGGSMTMDTPNPFLMSLEAAR
jgi:hypothetical protein